MAGGIRERVQNVEHDLQRLANDVFGRLSPGMVPVLRIVWVDARRYAKNPVEIVEDASWSPRACLAITGRELHEAEGAAQQDPEALWMHSDLRSFAARKLVVARLERDLAGTPWEVIATRVARFGDYDLVPALRFERAALERTDVLYAGRPLSLVRTVAEELLREITHHLLRGAEWLASFDLNNGYRRAGERLVLAAERAHLEGGRVALRLFDTINAIASMPYEGRNATGTIAIVGEQRAVDWHLALATPSDIGQVRWVRKLLEVSSAQVPLVASPTHVRGIGVPERHDDACEIRFRGRSTWTLKLAGQAVMNVVDGVPRVPVEAVGPEGVSSRIRRIFPEIGADAEQCLVDTVLAIASHKHGAMAVICEDAAREAARLQRQGMPIQPRVLDAETAVMLSEIDGALLLGVDGRCYAMGVILDGAADPEDPRSTPARGARYNSARRYVGNPLAPSRVLKIVFSEDKTVDFIPNLRPQVRRAELDAHVAELERTEASAVGRRCEVIAKLAPYVDYLDPSLRAEPDLSQIARHFESYDHRDDDVIA